MDIQLNGKLVSPSIPIYRYKAYLETLLSYGADAKESQLKSQLWYQDGKPMNAVNPLDDDTNMELKDWQRFISKSKSVEMMGRLHCDIFQQDRYLLNKVDMHIKLVKTPEAFHLMTDGTAVKTIIEDAVLYVRKVKVNPSIATEHNQMLDSGLLAKYPIRRGVVSTFTIAQGSMSANKDNVITGQLPRRVVVGLVSNSGHNGIVCENLYNFSTLG